MRHTSGGVLENNLQNGETRENTGGDLRVRPTFRKGTTLFSVLAVCTGLFASGLLKELGAQLFGAQLFGFCHLQRPSNRSRPRGVVNPQIYAILSRRYFGGYHLQFSLGLLCLCLVTADHTNRRQPKVWMLVTQSSTKTVHVLGK